VLDDNHTAAKILTKVIHQEAITEDPKFDEQFDIDLVADDLGVWIDPIGKRFF